ncbi:MAG: 2,3-bisphosphoglycerate-independent phosphoglycerate mutase [Methylococcales bacterium]
MSKLSKPFLLLILDGFGYRRETESNAIVMANTPVWDELLKTCSHTTLDCYGGVVGLPDGQMGNSEVGHLHLGSGRLLQQDFTRINTAIEDGSFYSNAVFRDAMDQAKKNDKALHIMGLLSPGGVHTHEHHIHAIIEMAQRQGLKKVFLHAFLDGRDTPPKSAAASIQAMETKLSTLGIGRIASIVGRFYAMDRDNRWERVEKAYRLIAQGKGAFQASTASEALENAYNRDETDEFVEPTAIFAKNEDAVRMTDGDVVICMNYRADRVREMSRVLTEPDFSEFDRGKAPVLGSYVSLTQYHQDLNASIAFPPFQIPNGLGEVLSKQGLTQLRLAETEKYAHVTFFFNGGVDTPFEGEDRILIPSPRVKTYDMKPEMSAEEVTDNLVAAIEGGKYDAIICNYANCDMVGHTGVLSAAVSAVETIDQSLGRIIAALKKVDGEMLLTADHGNIEMMVDPETHQAYTAHTTNPVPLLYFGGSGTLSSGGNLADIAPTLLALMGVGQPQEMTGRSLLH